MAQIEKEWLDRDGLFIRGIQGTRPSPIRACVRHSLIRLTNDSEHCG